ncbi:DNA invertase Pin-like site-specific DNA recombinase [Dokdonia sp. Hel_I_63]|nr:DNA invertase Pin-like site-specific DNA recombinase [Dokdonia sp. Hel_I_63]
MGLEYFNQYMGTNPIDKKINHNVWSYTRVSSKDQELNKSLAYQNDDAIRLAEEREFIITEDFGNTYESAKGDFTRKEFSKLIDRVKKARKKPHAILIYKMNRFSRSGGNGIAVAQELVHKYGVHLIETSSGISTETEQGEYQIWQKLLRARKENMERLEHTIPGLKKFVKEGLYLGKPPVGYTLYGTKVKDFSNRATEQRMEINEDGKLLIKAWKMKANGERDYIIRAFLEKRGLKMSKQKMSAMWTKPTYCGISTNKFLDEPIRGNWKPIVCQSDFKKVQEVLASSSRSSGYKVEKTNVDRPLTGFIFCSECNRKLTSYSVKKKGLHYYKCQSCKGVTLNANSSKKSIKVGAHNMLTDLMLTYKLEDKLIAPFKEQLKRVIKNNSNEEYELQEALLKRQKSVQTKIDKLTDMLIDELIDSGTFRRKKDTLEQELEEINSELNIDAKKISNLEKMIDDSVELSQNINVYWESGAYEVKRKVQELVFPEGLVVNSEKRQYLTKKVNRLFELKASITRDTKGAKTKKVSKNADLSSLVAGTGLEPVTFGL